MEHLGGFDSAPELAAKLLGPDSTRFRHVTGVAAAAARAAAAVPAGDEELLVAAAWLHDIGYAEVISETGFHPLDGARYLQRIGAPERLCRLVAHHTGSSIEAQARGLLDELTREFPPEQSPVADALTYADMTTGPDGTPLSATERVAEILTRYPAEHVVHGSISAAAPQLLSTVARVEIRIAAAGAPAQSAPAPRRVYRSAARSAATQQPSWCGLRRTSSRRQRLRGRGPTAGDESPERSIQVVDPQRIRVEQRDRLQPGQPPMLRRDRPLERAGPVTGLPRMSASIGEAVATVTDAPSHHDGGFEGAPCLMMRCLPPSFVKIGTTSRARSSRWRTAPGED